MICMVFLEIFRRRFSEVVTVYGYMLQKPFGAMVSSPMKKYCTDSRKRCIISTDISAKIAKICQKLEKLYASNKRDERRKSIWRCKIR